MIASFMKQIIFRGQFRVAWGTICHQDAFATKLVVGSTHCKAPVTRMRGALSGGGFPDLEAAATPKS